MMLLDAGPTEPTGTSGARQQNGRIPHPAEAGGKIRSGVRPVKHAGFRAKNRNYLK
jgi:hypothetical protein